MIGTIYRTIRVLSIDIVIGVVILLRFFCAQFEVMPTWHIYVLLGVAVWIIYTVDHMRDSVKASVGDRERYAFHSKNRKPLLLMVLILLCSVFPLLFFVPTQILLFGSALMVLSGIYLLVQQHLSYLFFKEFYIALVYVFGILMIPVLLGGDVPFIYFVNFLLLAFSNLILISWYEREQDEQDGFESIATRLGDEFLSKVLLVILSFGTLLSMLLADTIGLYFFICFCIYISVFIYYSYFGTRDRYRIVCDAVFLFPLLF
ncbi:MAG: UbiA family prenyltransferase [Ekhidna sp.]|nr:UbiA family prenyltransferase [Ekhidna sp.]